VERARELACLDPRRHAPVVNVEVPKKHQLPVPTPTEAGEWLAGFMDLLHEGVLALAPWEIRIRG
jgi:hypothetical protein